MEKSACLDACEISVRNHVEFYREVCPSFDVVLMFRLVLCHRCSLLELALLLDLELRSQHFELSQGISLRPKKVLLKAEMLSDPEPAEERKKKS